MRGTEHFPLGASSGHWSSPNHFLALPVMIQTARTPVTAFNLDGRLSSGTVLLPSVQLEIDAALTPLSFASQLRSGLSRDPQRLPSISSKFIQPTVAHFHF